MINNDARVAVCSRSFSQNPKLRAELLKKYSQVSFNETGESLKSDSLIRFLKGHDHAIIALEQISAEILAALPELKIISKYGVGLDNIDLTALANQKVRLGWTPGVNKRAVAELVLAQSITLLRGSHLSQQDVLNHVWRQHKGREISHSTIGIIGCGNIGQELVQLLGAFGSRLLVYDIADYGAFYKKNKVEVVSLNALLAESDLVTLHIPYSKSNHHFLGPEQLELMKKGSYLVNAARGGLVDEFALKQLIENGHLAGAYLDVLSEEPPFSSQVLLDLIENPYVLVTGHIGGSTQESIFAMGISAIEGLHLAKRVEEIYVP